MGYHDVPELKGDCASKVFHWTLQSLDVVLCDAHDYEIIINLRNFIRRFNYGGRIVQ